jgi:cysteinyl-tRNA synthetase
MEEHRRVRLYNTLGRRLVEVRPLRPPAIGLYTCGPTVYDYAHIGNLRTYLFADLLRRTLTAHGLVVRHVMNVTDVGHLTDDADEGEDKLLVGSRREGKDPWQIARFYEAAFVDDCRRLAIEPPHVVCRATEHIEPMIALIERLMAAGAAYETTDGVYFSVERFPDYGRLSGAPLARQRAGARVAVNETKRHPADFALWIKAPREHIMHWPSPWGRRYPGWHIECSAMSMRYLGESFDIHTGGVDHIPVHHENEIAQSEAATGRPLAQIWAHSAFLQVDGGKMSKSLGNTYTLATLHERGFTPLAFRYFCLTGHYRAPLNFTWSALAAADTGWQRLRALATALAARTEPAAGADPPEALATLRQQFWAALRDDLNAPRALAAVWEVARGTDAPAARAMLLREFDAVLGLDVAAGIPTAPTADLPPEIAALVERREELRRRRDWAGADALRSALQQRGYAVDDTPAGSRWRKL